MYKSRLCVGSKKKEDKTLSGDCILVRCYSPKTEQSSNKSWYESNQKYWKMGVGKSPGSNMATNNEEKKYDPAVVDETLIYNVEHMNDHSLGGPNAFSNFVMTWGVVNIKLGKSDKGRLKRGFHVLLQWEAVYGKLLRYATYVQKEFCDEHVTTEKRFFFTKDKNNRKKGRTIKIIPRDYKSKDRVIGHGGLVSTVPFLDVNKLNENLGKIRSHPTDSNRMVSGWDVLEWLLGSEGPCNDNVIHKDFYET